jgi:uncharacterized protein
MEKNRASLALALLIPVPSLATAASLFWWPGTILGTGLFLAGKLWIVLLPLFWQLRVDRAPLSWSPARRGGFITAALLGLAIGLLILAAYAATLRFHWIDPITVGRKATDTGLNQLPVYLLGALYWITLNSLMEEYVWRWFAFRQFEKLVGGPLAVVAAALAFTAHHVIALAAQFSWSITLLGSLGVFTGGAAWSWLYLRYRSVWPAYLSHALADLPIFYIGYRLIFHAPAL